MATTDFTGMFQKLGIDTRTEEQVLANRAKQDNIQRQARNDARPEDFLGDRALRSAGQRLGGIINDKFGKPAELEPQEQANVDAITAAQVSFEEKKERGLFLDKDGKDDLVKEADGFQNAVAAELIKINDPRGLDLARATDAGIRQRAKDDQEREKGGLDIAAKTQDNLKGVYDFEREQMIDTRGDIVNFWKQGETDPNNSMTGFVGDDGVARTESGAEFPVGTYTTHTPKVPKSVLDSGRPLKPQDFGWSSAAVGKVQANQRNLFSQYSMAVAMRDAMASAVTEDGTIEMMGTGGKISKGIATLVGNMQSLGRSFSKALEIETPDGKVTKFDGSSSAAASYARNNQHLFNEDMIPQSIRDDKDAVARFQAIIVQFAYGKARMNEESGRISDSDFDHAIMQIGAAATDPAELQKIIMGDLSRAGAKHDLWVATMPDGLRPLIFPQESLDIFQAERDNFNSAFSLDFGTALNVGQGLTTPQGQERSGGVDEGLEDRVAVDPDNELDALTRQLQELQRSNAAAEGE